MVMTTRREHRSSSNSSPGGVGFAGLLTVAFIVLKLCKVIAWSWWWVLAPLWISAALVLAVLVSIALVVTARVWLLPLLRRRPRPRHETNARPDDDAEALPPMHGPVQKWGYRPAGAGQTHVHCAGLLNNDRRHTPDEKREDRTR